MGYIFNSLVEPLSQAISIHDHLKKSTLKDKWEYVSISNWKDIKQLIKVNDIPFKKKNKRASMKKVFDKIVRNRLQYKDKGK